MQSFIDGEMLIIAGDEFTDPQSSDAIFIPILDLKKVLCLNYRMTRSICPKEHPCRNCKLMNEWMVE